MDTAKTLTGLLAELRRVNEGILDLHSRLARGKHWDEATRVFEWARSLDELIGQMASGGGSGRSGPAAAISPRLPYFYVNRDQKLVMRARSLRSGHYKHRVIKPHYDLIMDKVSRLARDGEVFYSRDLQNREEMPTHEPLLVMRLLVDKGLLNKLSKGRFSFDDASRFASRAAQLWSELPRESGR